MAFPSPDESEPLRATPSRSSAYQEPSQFSSKYDFLQEKLRKLDDRVAISSSVSTKKFASLKEQLVRFQKELDGEREHRESFSKAKSAELITANEALEEALLAEQAALRETEARIVNLFESKTNSLKEEITTAGRLRMDNEANLRRYLDVDIPKLYEALREEVAQRENMEQRMLKKAIEECAQLKTAISEEKKARIDTEEAMLRMMEDVVTKMQGEISSERRDRERTEEMLMNLLNETCDRLQNASQI